MTKESPKTPLARREEGLKLLQNHDYIMAGWAFSEAIADGDIASYSYLGELVYNGDFTEDCEPDVNEALAYWELGMKQGDKRSEELFKLHKDERIRNMTEIRFDNGNCYKGDVNADGLPHGTGHMDYELNGYYGSYDGQWKNGERSGKGHYHQFSKGGAASHSYDYDGEWRHDKQHGQGVEAVSGQVGLHLSTVTEVYTGTFRKGRRHGAGTIVADHFDGDFTGGKDRFTGAFLEGHAEGKGQWLYANGDCFEGEISNDLRNGPGKYTFKDGLSFKGVWKEDVLLPETIGTDPSQELPLLLVTEHHSGFGYNRTGTFLIPVKNTGMALYEEAATVSKDAGFPMNGAGLAIMAVARDSVTFLVKEAFTKDGKPLEVTVRRGETVNFKVSRDGSATIYDEAHDYTTEDALEVSCR